MSNRNRHRFDSAKASQASRFAEALADALHDLKLTHMELAGRLGVSLYTVDSWTRAGDPKIPGELNLNRLCALLEERQAGLGRNIAASAGLDWSQTEPRQPAVNDALPISGVTNLPRPLTSFVGRSRLLEELPHLLGDSRLVTLLGTGGIGKTRLAREIGSLSAGRFADGVWLVELASVDGARVSEAIHQALGVPEGGEAEFASSLSLDALSRYLKERHLLMILDNCEHVVQEVAAVVAGLLPACPRLRVLATSRRPLGVAGEVVWQVPALSLPRLRRSLAPPEAYEALRLFVERARIVVPGFALTEQNAACVARICTSLEGVPLAIELAAGWMHVLDVSEIAARLDAGFGLLTRGPRSAPPRHRTMQACIGWSYDLLSQNEQVMLRRAAVFAGGWTLEAAQAILHPGLPNRDLDPHEGALQNAQPTVQVPESSFEVPAVLEGTAQLVEKSLVSVSHRDEVVRYRLLEMIRRFAWERLEESGEAEEVQGAHARYFLGMVEGSRHLLRGPEQAILLERWEREHDNLREALTWAQAHEPVTALRLAVALWPFWYARGHLHEGYNRLVSALRRAEDAPLPMRAQALNAAGTLVLEQGGLAEAEAMLEQGLVLKRQIGAPAGIGASLVNLGSLAMGREQYERAQSLYGEALDLYTQLEDRGSIAVCLASLGNVARARQRPLEAMELYERSIETCREIGDIEQLAGVLLNYGTAATNVGNLEQADLYCREALRLFADLGDRGGMAQCLEELARVSFRQRQPRTATRMLSTAHTLRQEIAMPVQAKEGAEHAQLLSDLRTSLGDAAFTEAWTTTEAQTLDEIAKSM